MFKPIRSNEGTNVVRENDGAADTHATGASVLKARQAALEQAGVSGNSGFVGPNSVPSAQAAPSPAADPNAPTVRASQLANGTTTLDQLPTPAAASPKYAVPGGGDLASITSGAEGMTPLTRTQVEQTVLQALPDDQRERASAMIGRATADSLASAFSQVIAARASGGTQTLNFELKARQFHQRNLARFEYEEPIEAAEDQTQTISASVTFDANGAVNGKPLAADEAVASDVKVFPDGNTADQIKSAFELRADAGDLAGIMSAAQPPISRQVLVETVVAALPAEQRAAAQALIATGVTDDSLARAFSQVIEQRKTPGDKKFDLSLTPLITTSVWDGGGEDGRMLTSVNPGPPVTYGVTMAVSDDGKVNGTKLPADLYTQLLTTAAPIPQEFKDAALKEAGLSDDWMLQATPDQKDYAYFKIAEARLTPGTKTLDLGVTFTSVYYSESGEVSSTATCPGSLTLSIDEQGKVNGKMLSDVLSLNAIRVVDEMPTALRRQALMQVGFKSSDIDKASVGERRSALMRIAMKAQGPAGTSQFEMQFAGEKYAVGLKIGEDHNIEGAGVAVVPKPKKKSWWKSIVSVVCAVVSVVFPVVAPICMGINAAIAISSGAKGLALVGALVGAAAGIASVAGFAGVAGAAGTASTFGSISTGISAANGAVNAFKHGDILGALTSAVAMGSGLISSGVLPNGLVPAGVTNALGTVSKYAGLASGAMAISHGDLAGGLSQLGQAAGQTGLLDASTASNIKTAGQVVAGVKAAERGDIAGVINAGLGAAGSLGYIDTQTGITVQGVVSAASALARGNPFGALNSVMAMNRASDAARRATQQVDRREYERLQAQRRQGVITEA